MRSNRAVAGRTLSGAGVSTKQFGWGRERAGRKGLIGGLIKRGLGAAHDARRVHLMPMNSTSKISVAFAGITGGWPRAPYA